jgi:uncharacterized protein YeaO (DUF488 family)
MRSLAPSEALLRQYQTGEIRWRDFKKLYRREMLKGLVDETTCNPRMGNGGQKHLLQCLNLLAEHKTITLLCACSPSEKHCHRHVLEALLKG